MFARSINLVLWIQLELLHEWRKVPYIGSKKLMCEYIVLILAALQ